MSGRALVSGMICAQPNQGGATWAVMQFVLGLRRLGWDVHFVETLDGQSIRPTGAPLEQSENAAYLAMTMSTFGLNGAWSLVERDGAGSCGVPRAELQHFASQADLLLNISGCLTDDDLVAGPGLRVYLDLDPGFTQLWQSVQGIDMQLDRHDRLVTVGLSIGDAECVIPTCGREWIRIFPPVVLEQWPTCSTAGRPEMTTVGHWRGYGSIEYRGLLLGQRAHTLRRLLPLPSCTPQTFVLALDIHPHEARDIAALATNGWRTVHPQSIASDVRSYQQFVRESRAELGIPKSGYVDSHSGWFSDRSACYLASGRPVITAATGFEDYLPVGEGLLAYRDCDEAVECIASVNRDYRRHALAARRVAEEFLDSDRVLSKMLDVLVHKAVL
jgi:hypothetical protein